MRPRSWTCSRTHSARRLLPTPASPIIATIRCWGGCPAQTDTTMFDQLLPLRLARDHRRRTQGEEARRERPRGGHGAAHVGRARGLGRRRWRARHGLLERRGVARTVLGPDAARIGRELEAMPGLLGEQALDERADLRRNAFRQRRRGHGLALVRTEHLLGVALEDLLAGQHAIDDAPEGVEVRRRPDERCLLADLLRRDPADGAGARVHRELGLGSAVETRVVAGLTQPRETEVEDVRARSAAGASEISITFDGLRSPWMMCRACAWPRPAST